MKVKVKIEFDYTMHEPDEENIESVEEFIFDWVKEEFAVDPIVTLTEIESE